MSEFREMRRLKQQLSPEECAEVLKTELRGILSVLGEGGYPYGMPMNHYLHEDGNLYFHCGRGGHREDALKSRDKVSFCVLDKGWQREGEWARHIRSVIVFGHVEWVEDRETVYALSRLLSRKFTHDEGYIEREIARSGPGTRMFRLVPEHISGKLVEES